MPLLDIEKAINDEKLQSRFKLVHLAGLRAREINSPKDSTTPMQVKAHHKITTRALAEIIEEKISFVETTPVE